MSGRVSASLALAVALTALPAAAQDISGKLFEDRDGDGIHDPGEPGLPGFEVRLFGRPSAGGAVQQSIFTAGDGSFAFAPGNGCYLLAPTDPPDWRAGVARSDGFPQSTPGYQFPVGQPRWSKLDRGIDNLAAGSLRYTAMGDSIAANFNVLCGSSAFWYSEQLRTKLACVAPTATVVLDRAAVLGQHTDDLLVDDTSDLNNVFRVIEAQPELVSVSMIGNDLLDVDPGPGPTQLETNRAVAEVLDARQNLQEALSALVSEVPQADIVLNTLYDNEAYACAPGDFHRTWLPIVNQVLRDLAWGQTRRLAVNEVGAEFARVDQSSACTGFENRICQFFLDLIHPTSAGYTIIREKLWESAGGVHLGPADALGRTTMAHTNYGYVRRVRRLLPSSWETRNGALATDPAAVLDDGDGGAAASIRLGNGQEEFRVGGFPDWYDEIRIARTVTGVRYRTAGSGQPVDELYRMEASVTGEFRPPPGFAYTPTNWNFYTPIVGGGGPNRPLENPDYPTAKTLVRPVVPIYREVSATLTKNPTLAPGAGEYAWPALTHEELATTTIRVAASPLAGAQGDDDYAVELDYAWIDLYGWEVPRPPEVSLLKVDRRADGTLVASFDPLAGAERYNLYRGRIETVRAGLYDHGSNAPAVPLCDATTQPGTGGRLEIEIAPGAQSPESVYVLLTAHVDDVESPAGVRSDTVEIDRSHSICR